MTADRPGTFRNRNALMPGTVLRDYVLVSAREEGVGESDELGSGGFGIVYLARHRDRDHWLFAIKEFFPGELAVRDAGDGSSVWPATAEAVSALDDGLTRFRREAEQLRRFRNERHVVSCVNYFEANATAYMVMDYDDGVPLSKYLRLREGKGRPFTEADLLAVALPLLEGLSVVHRAEVLHRDIKPGNVFVRREDDRAGRPAEPVLMDFGAAKQQYLSRHSRSNAPYTPGYAAPEQHTSLGRLTPATDIYAVGALLWRMVAGGAAEHPKLMVADDREGSEAGSVVWNPAPRDAAARAFELHPGRPDPMPSAQALGKGRFSGHILRAIDRCLSIDAKARPQDCGELLGLLRDDMPEATAAHKTEDAGGGDDSPAQGGADEGAASGKQSTARRRWPWLVGGLAAAAAAGVAAGVLGWWPVWTPVADPEVELGVDTTVSTGETPGPDALSDAAPVEEAQPAVLGGGRAIVVVETEPPGARVLIGGRAAGETPLERDDVRVGVHDVVLDHPDYEPVELAKQSFSDGVVLRIERTLVPATGRLTVMTQPREAWVEFDGRRLAAGTPVTLDELPAGSVELTLGAEAYRTVRVMAEVPRDGVGRLEWTLEPIPYGALTLELVPSDAVVTLPDDGITYEPGISLLEGEYRVMVSSEGYESATRTVEVSGDTRERIVLEVAPQPFTVQAMPAGARVELSGGGGSYVPGIRLMPGEYRVRVSMAGYDAWEGLVSHGLEPTLYEVELEREPAPRIRDALASGGEGPELVVIPGGRFRMGCVSGQDCDDDEFPVHEVAIPEEIAVSVYEVTFAEWDACVAGGGCGGYRPADGGWGRGNRPVIHVSWDDAKEYVAWLSRQTGQTYRLLSEAEWEYVARAGSSSAYSWGNAIGSNRANCLGCGSRLDDAETAPVGSFQANAFGAYDMHGNVWEWVEDCWNDSYTGAPSDSSVWRTGDCESRVLRGGAWNDDPRSLRSANRFGNTSGNRYVYIGFRVARTLTP